MVENSIKVKMSHYGVKYNLLETMTNCFIYLILDRFHFNLQEVHKDVVAKTLRYCFQGTPLCVTSKQDINSILV